MTRQFIGRDAELATLNRYFEKKVASLVVVKGRRRVGKSRLIDEFAKGKTFFRFVGLGPNPEVTAQMQRDEFARRLRQYFPELPELRASDWGELFDLLAARTGKDKLVILFDEISWMAHDDASFLGKLRNAWDESFQKNNQLMLVLCGSISSWIERNILSSTDFVGRVNYVLTLKELTLPFCAEFWGRHAKQVSAYDKLKFLAVSGGIPLYLENLDPRIPVDDNLKQLCFEPGALLLREFDNIFHDLFGLRSKIYKQLVLGLIDGPADIATICRRMKVEPSGAITEYLTDLVEAGFLSRDYTWALQTATRSKLSRFRLSDNYLRFYLRYLDKQKDKIERGLFVEKSTASLPGWAAVMGLQVENLVLNNRPLIWQALGLSAQDIVNDGAFFQTKTQKQKGCQVDYLIQTRFNTLFICEIKFSRNEIKSSVIEEVAEKVKRMAKPRNFSYFPVLIHVNGVSDAVLDADYFFKVIDFGALLDH
jgi:hypothetical protein